MYRILPSCPSRQGSKAADTWVRQLAAGQSMANCPCFASDPAHYRRDVEAMSVSYSEIQPLSVLLPDFGAFLFNYYEAFFPIRCQRRFNDKVCQHFFQLLFRDFYRVKLSIRQLSRSIGQLSIVFFVKFRRRGTPSRSFLLMTTQQVASLPSECHSTMVPF